jgi:acyl-CoA thioester hydrolase
MQELLNDFPVVIDIPVAWGEMDAFGHVNNIIYFRYFESARAAYFEKLSYWEFKAETGIGPILASTQCQFKAPLTYPDTVSVGATIPDIQQDRFVMKYRVVSHDLQRVVAEGDGLIVSYDYRAKEKAPLPEELRQRILNIENGR